MPEALAAPDHSGSGVTESVFEQFKSDLVALKDHVKSKLLSMANILHLMSHRQVVEIKRFARTCDMSANLIDNLCLVGSGEMTIELALAPCRINNRLFRSLPSPEKTKLNDVTTPVEVLTSRGVVVKPISELDAFQIREVVQAGVGILPASKQVPIFSKIASTQKRVDRTAESAFLFDGLNVTSDKHVLLFGRDSGDAPGSKTVCLKLTAAEWKRIRAQH